MSKIGVVWALVIVAFSGCSGDETTPSPVQNDAGQDMPDVSADLGADAGDVGAVCEGLFGNPNETTGLDSSMCRPVCACSGDTVEAAVFDEATLQVMAAQTLSTPFDVLNANPYETPESVIYQPEKVCAVVRDGDAYRLETFDGAEGAEAAGASITHYGACGLCSSLENMVAYARNPDLTDPVRACGVKGVFEGEEANITCLMELGFDRPCAQIWYYNTLNTREACGTVCAELLNEPYHLPDGSLNACLQCDEDESGRVFKAVAGRTRRNSGLASAICRPCSTVRPVAHDYGF